MLIRHKILGAAALGAIVLTGACTTNPETGNKRISRAAIGGVAGAVGGYFLGDLIGGKRDRTEKIVGAGIGAVAGAGIGAVLGVDQWPQALPGRLARRDGRRRGRPKGRT